MRQIQRSKPKKRSFNLDLDLRTPSGRLLPF